MSPPSFPPVPVLNYHHVHDGADPSFRVTPGRLRRQLAFLQREGFKPLSAAEMITLKGRASAARRPVFITFDDAYANFADHALPVLAEAGVPATLFVIGGYLGGWNEWDALRRSRHRHLTAAQIKEVAGQGVTIGSHTWTHPDLTRLGRRHLAAEVAGSRRRLRRLIGGPVRLLSYPGGHVNGRVAAAAARSYDLAFATDAAGGAVAGDPYRLPRIDAAFCNTEDELWRRLLPFARAPKEHL